MATHRQNRIKGAGQTTDTIFRHFESLGTDGMRPGFCANKRQSAAILSELVVD
jgi:hypothetical protein